MRDREKKLKHKQLRMRHKQKYKITDLCRLIKMKKQDFDQSMDEVSVNPYQNGQLRKSKLVEKLQ